MDKNIYFVFFILLTASLLSACEEGYTEINDLCFHNGDMSFIQDMIDNSYQSGIDLGCQDGDMFCGSPNPYMDDLDNWMWVVVDGISYQWSPDGNGVVDPLELGLQEWEDGRLTSLMCGAYIYCQLSGPIPDEINQLSNLNVLRLEYNYLSGNIPDEICELNINNDDYLEFDLSGNHLCPPYPECISTSDSSFWFQDTSECFDLGDLNLDGNINILDIVEVVDVILTSSFNYLADLNSDNVVNVSDIVIMVNFVLNNGTLSDECYLEPDPGNCFAAIPAYYYNLDSHSCEMFTWGGCGGTVPFDTLEDCINSCQ